MKLHYSVLALLLIADTAVAQVLPANLDAGAVGTFQNKQEDIKKLKEKLKQPKQKVEIEGLVEPKNQKVKTKSGIQFKLTHLDFNGNTVFSDKELADVAKSYVNNVVTYEDLMQIVIDVTSFYQSKGYVTSVAYLAPQKIVDGHATITVLEGKVGELNIEGNEKTKDYYFTNSVFASNDIEEGEVLNIEDLKNSMVKINNKSFLDAKVLLDKGEELATTDIDLKVEESSPLELTSSWGNQGRDLIGVQQFGVGVAHNNLTGYGDRLGVYTLLSSGSEGYGLDYSIPVGSHGTKLTAAYSYSAVDLGGIYKAADIEGASHFYKLGILQDLYNRDGLNLTGDVSFDFRDSETTFIGGDLDKYQTRTLRIGSTAIKDDNKGRSIGRLETSFGLPILGAQDTSGKSIADGEFKKLNGSFTRIHALPSDFLGIFRGSFQLSDAALYGSEQIQLGGVYTVRGFDEAVLLGDSGYTLSAEARHVVPGLSDLSIPLFNNKSYTLNLKDKVYAAAFYDMGFAKQNYTGESTNHTNYLQSVGVGLRTDIGKNLTANLDWGFPIGPDRYEDQSSSVLHFSISAKLY
tara:strand:- start:3149 stop:4873 length:1725 start_codon:yes stop_codon:yes gene_type:complete